MYKLFLVQACFPGSRRMDRVRSWWSRAANFVAGVETAQHGGGEEDEEACMAKGEDGETCVYLVTYGGYGSLPTFDPDCLVAMVLWQSRLVCLALS